MSDEQDRPVASVVLLGIVSVSAAILLILGSLVYALVRLDIVGISVPGGSDALWALFFGWILTGLGAHYLHSMRESTN